MTSEAFNDADAAYDGMLGTGPSGSSVQHALTVPEGILSRGLGTGVTGYRLGRSQDAHKSVVSLRTTDWSCAT